MPISRVQTGLPRATISPENGNEGATTPQASQAQSLSRFLIANVTASSKADVQSLEARFAQERDKAQTIEELETLLDEKSPFAAVANSDYQLHLKLGKVWIEKIEAGDTSREAAKKAYKYVYRAKNIAVDDDQRTNEAQVLVAKLPELKESDSDETAAEPTAPPKKDLKQLRDEAIHYIRIAEQQNNPHLRVKALQKLKAIAQTEWGRQDWKTQYHFASLAYEGKYVEEAFEAAEKAMKLASKEDDVKKSRALLEGTLKKYYGSVKLCRSPASDLTTGYIRPVPETALINVDKKAIFADVVERLRKRVVTLPSYEDCTNGKAAPLTLYLPGGRFYIGTSDAIEIKEGVELPPQKVVLQGAEADNTGTYAGIALVAGILAALGFGIASGLNDKEQGVKLIK